MSERLYFLISLVLVLFMAGNVSAQLQRDIEWDNDGGDGDRMWDVAVNWDLDIVPTLEEDDVAIMDATYTDIDNGPIIQDGIDAECGWFEMGYKRPADEVYLTMTGGTLTAGGWIDVGGYNSGYFEFDMNGGEVTVIGQGEGTWEGIWLAYAKDAIGVMDVNGGDLDIFGGLWLGWNENSYGLYNMTGGTYEGHYVYVGTWEDQGGAGRLNLYGGTMHVKDFAMGPVAHMDITEGVLTCDTDLLVSNGWLFDPDNDYPISGAGDGVRRDAPGYTATLPMLVAKGLVTAYDVNSGDIITDANYPDKVGLRALVQMDYDSTNPGMTTVTATAVDPNLAYNPIPFDRARSVQPSEYIAISWSAGTNAVKHDVYFGTDETAVANADTLSYEYKGRQTGTNYTPDSNYPYVLDADYFWRIDEVNANDGVEWPGSVWRFRTSDHVVVDDFDSYEAYVNDIFDTWVEAGRANVDLQTIEDDPNYVRNDQSMKYNFRNNYAPYYSEATRTFSPAQDWTLGETQALVLWFHGEPGNAVEKIYLTISDGSNEATIVYDDPNDMIQEPEDEWNEWNVDFAELTSEGVDLSNISSTTIGIGDGVSPGGTGYVYFEDIRLYPTRCRPDISRLHGDFDGDCDTDSYDMDILAQTWLMSDRWIISAVPTYDPDVWLKFDEGTGQVAVNSGLMGSGYNGQLGNLPTTDPCDPTWITNDPCSERQRCLQFDGLHDYVEVPSLDFNSNTVTITAWVKREGQVADAAIVFSREGATPEGICLSGQGDELRYAWNNDGTWWWETGLIVPDGEWTFAALVVEPTQATVYMSDGITYSSATNEVEHIVQAFDGVTTVGRDWDERNFLGLIDDVRIYNTNLDLGEIMGLAGVDATVYGPLEVVSNIVPRVPDPAVDPNYYPENPDIVNLRDYAAFADGWLGTVLWP